MMKNFLVRLGWFILPLAVTGIIALSLPVTPRASTSLLMAEIKKDSLLINTPSPRIIFVGGSNLSFGLNSKLVKDSLKINPINTAIHASIGLKFMMDNTLQFIKKNDTVILIPEYSHFFRDVNYGSEELLRTIFDVDPSKIDLLNTKQVINILPFMPKYILSKYNPGEYRKVNISDTDVYSVKAFNDFGDVYVHWNLHRQNFLPYQPITESLNTEVIRAIQEFYTRVKEKGASMYISYPGFQSTSYNTIQDKICEVAQALKETGIPILGTPEQYRIPDSLLFNSPYHLNKDAVNTRTRMLIADFNKARNHSKNTAKI